MLSTGSTHVSRCTAGAKGALRRLRRAAGYRSAEDFAKAIGISPSTYAAYELSGGGVDGGIPLGAAWKIADGLACSIDQVVGREAVDGPDRRSVQLRYDTLTSAGRALVDSYLDFVEQSEERCASIGLSAERTPADEHEGVSDAESLSVALDEADRRAECTSVRYAHDEVFGPIREGLEL